jgi:hypothetical protein
MEQRFDWSEGLFIGLFTILLAGILLLQGPFAGSERPALDDRGVCERQTFPVAGFPFLFH